MLDDLKDRGVKFHFPHPRQSDTTTPTGRAMWHPAADRPRPEADRAWRGIGRMVADLFKVNRTTLYRALAG